MNLADVIDRQDHAYPHPTRSRISRTGNSNFEIRSFNLSNTFFDLVAATNSSGGIVDYRELDDFFSFLFPDGRQSQVYLPNLIYWNGDETMAEMNIMDHECGLHYNCYGNIQARAVVEREVKKALDSRISWLSLLVLRGRIGRNSISISYLEQTVSGCCWWVR